MMQPPQDEWQQRASSDTTAPPEARSAVSGQGSFNTTHWSVVLLATDQETSAPAQAALEKLCRTYWYPLYVFVRRHGYKAHDAQDLTQGFFERLLDRRFLSGVDRRKGKFRSYLLAALEHFLANEWRRTQAQKRGGGARFISLDAELPDEPAMEIAAAMESPEKAFERQWAATLLGQVLQRLRAEFAAGGKDTLFDQLKSFLTGDKQAATYAELAPKIGMTEAGLKMAVSRMKHRYGEILREEISMTVASPEEVDEELRCLYAALS
jgi:RNA polymerase sigma factor (sigma-70 family)